MLARYERDLRHDSCTYSKTCSVHILPGSLYSIYQGSPWRALSACPSTAPSQTSMCHPAGRHRYMCSAVSLQANSTRAGHGIAVHARLGCLVKGLYKVTYRHSSRVLLCDDFGSSWNAVPICEVSETVVS